MVRNNYRLYFGRGGYIPIKKSTMTFKARNQKEAEKKASNFLCNAEIRGTYCVKREA